MTADLFPAKGKSLTGKPTWEDTTTIPAISFTCGHCGNLVANRDGFKATVAYQQLLGSRMEKSAAVGAYVHICHICGRPTYFSPHGDQHPIGSVGRSFKHVPGDLKAVYAQAHRCLKAGCLEACVMVGRRVLMVLSWRLNAEDGLTFQQYVDYLVQIGAISAPMKVWVDKIRQIGNAANHEVPDVAEDDAKTILKFIELVFDNVFEAPGDAGVASPFTLRP